MFSLGCWISFALCGSATPTPTPTPVRPAFHLDSRADISVEPSNISPWIDANFAPAEVVNAMLAEQTHRRFSKTHTPLDGIPFYPECTYLAVYRDPRDTYFSMISHLDNMTDERAKARIRVEVHAGCRAWSQEAFVEGEAQQFSLAYNTLHFETFWRYRDLSNVHLCHYADMTRRLARSIRAVGEATNVPVDAVLSDAMAETASFSNMRLKAHQFAPGASGGQWKRDEAFFDKGKSGRWREVLDHEDLEIYRDAVARLLPLEAVQWLEQGIQS